MRVGLCERGGGWGGVTEALRKKRAYLWGETIRSTWSNRSVKEKAGLSVGGGGLYAGGLIGGEIQYLTCRMT